MSTKHVAAETRANAVSRPATIAEDGLPQGWFLPGEADAYRRAASRVRRGLVVEVGVYLGRSISSVAAVCRANGNRLVAIDHWVGCPELKEPENGVYLLDKFRDNMQWLGLWDAIEVMEADSAAGAERFADESVDLLFLDATHSKDAVLRDVHAWWPKIKTGGVLLGHDFNTQAWPGVVQAVEELFGTPDETSASVWKVAKTSPTRLRAA